MIAIHSLSDKQHHRKFFWLPMSVFNGRTALLYVCDSTQWYDILIPVLTVTHQMNIINSQLRQTRAYLLFYSNHMITVWNNRISIFFNLTTVCIFNINCYQEWVLALFSIKEWIPEPSFCIKTVVGYLYISLSHEFFDCWWISHLYTLLTMYLTWSIVMAQFFNDVREIGLIN
jgi:hypothetical protein